MRVLSHLPCLIHQREGVTWLSPKILKNHLLVSSPSVTRHSCSMFSRLVPPCLCLCIGVCIDLCDSLWCAWWPIYNKGYQLKVACAKDLYNIIYGWVFRVRAPTYLVAVTWAYAEPPPSLLSPSFSGSSFGQRFRLEQHCFIKRRKWLAKPHSD